MMGFLHPKGKLGHLHLMGEDRVRVMGERGEFEEKLMQIHDNLLSKSKSKLRGRKLVNAVYNRFHARKFKLPLRFKKDFRVDPKMKRYIENGNVQNLRNIFRNVVLILTDYKKLELEMESLKIDKFPEKFFNKFEILVNDLNGSLKRSSSRLRTRDVKYKLNEIINDFPKNFRAGTMGKEFTDYLVKVDFFYKIYKYMGYKSGDLD